MASKEVMAEIKKIKDLIESLKGDFESKFDESSESWQNGERGEQCMSNISSCQDAIDSLDGVE